MRYIIFNKPYGVISQFTTDLNHQTLAGFDLPKEVYPVGRLDKDSEGLLLLSNDGPFIDSFLKRHPRVYWSQVEKEPSEEDLWKLSQGVQIKSGLTLPCSVKSIDPPTLEDRVPPIRYRKTVPTSWIELELKEGKNRQVRKMTAAIGYPTLRLYRIGLGKIRLFKNFKLEPGKWEEVTKNQII